MLCLQNLVTSLTLKNPLYTRVIEVFRAALRPRLTALEQGLDALKDRRAWVQRQLHLSDWQIGRRIRQLQEGQVVSSGE
jgi:hypothetical protein